jgi:hypothetical protein
VNIAAPQHVKKINKGLREYSINRNGLVVAFAKLMASRPRLRDSSLPVYPATSSQTVRASRGAVSRFRAHPRLHSDGRNSAIGHRGLRSPTDYSKVED